MPYHVCTHAKETSPLHDAPAPAYGPGAHLMSRVMSERSLKKKKKPICVNGYSLCKEKEEERRVELKIAKASLIPSI